MFERARVECGRPRSEAVRRTPRHRHRSVVGQDMTKGSGRTAAEEKKRQRRFERQRQETAAKHRIQLRRRVRNITVGTVLVALIGVGGFFVLRPGSEVEGVIRPPNRGRNHVSNATYNTPTPTSGPHNPSSPRCGFVSQGLPPDLAVHALEHGAVVVWYRPDIDAEVQARALVQLQEWDSHWILSPNPGIEEPFVATAWNRLMVFDEPGEGLAEFVDTYRSRGPERVSCPA